MGSRKKEPPLMTSPKIAIGIDLGSSKCCVGLVRDGRVEILENERGNKTTPSYVAFTEAERLVGESALDQVALNPTNTVFGAKWLLGRKGESPETIKRLTKHLPYNVTQENAGVRIKVAYKGKEKTLSPEQIAAMLLSQMKKLAEKHMDSPVLEAVIAVPAHFTNAQRRALKDAGTIAGLTVLGLISETTAAAVAYQDGKTFAKKQNVLVVDIGGGAFNAAVVEVQDASVEVKAICGTPELSGGELDRVLVDHLADRFTKLNKVDVKENKKGFERLKIACQKAKHTLTLLPETVVQVDCIFGERDFSDTIKRAQLNKKILPAAQETIKKVLRNVLSDASLSAPEIDEVVLIGGTTRVPALQEAVVKFFDGKSLNKTVNPDEAVAYGAALQAAILVGDNSVAEVRVTDIVMNPVDYTERFRKQRPFVPMKTIEVPRVGSSSVVYCERIGRKNKSTLEHVVDSFGVYCPRGNREALKNQTKTHVDVMKVNRYLTDEEIRAMEKVVKFFNDEDLNYNRVLSAVSVLEALCFKVKGRFPPLENSKRDASDGRVSKRTEALTNCEECLEWLQQNEIAFVKTYLEKTQILQDLFAAAETEMIAKSVDVSGHKKASNESCDIKKSETSESVLSNVQLSDFLGVQAGHDVTLAKEVAVIEAKYSDPGTSGALEQPLDYLKTSKEINEQESNTSPHFNEESVYAIAGDSPQDYNLEEKNATKLGGAPTAESFNFQCANIEHTADNEVKTLLKTVLDTSAGMDLNGESVAAKVGAPQPQDTRTADEEASKPLEVTAVGDEATKPQDVTAVDDEATKPHDVSAVDAEATKPQDVTAVDDEAAKPLEVTAVDDEAEKPQEVTGVDDEAAKPQEDTAVDDEAVKPQEVTAVDDEAAKPQDVTAVDDGAAKPLEVTAVDDEAEKPQEVTAVDDEAAKPQEVTAVDDEAAKQQDVTAVDDEAAKPQKVTAVDDEAAKTQKVTAVDDEAAKPQDVTAVDDEAAKPQDVTAVNDESVNPLKVTAVDDEAAKAQKATAVDDEAAKQQETIVAANGTAKQFHDGAAKQQETIVAANGTAKQQETMVAVNGAAKQQETIVAANGTAKQQETMVAVNGAAKQQETIVAANGTAKQQETMVPLDRAAKQQETIVAANGTAKQQETKVAGNGAAKQQETIVAANGTAKQQETMVPLDRAAKQQETIVAANGANKQQETTVAADGAAKQQESLAATNEVSKPQDIHAAENGTPWLQQKLTASQESYSQLDENRLVLGNYQTENSPLEPCPSSSNLDSLVDGEYLSEAAVLQSQLTNGTTVEYSIETSIRGLAATVTPDESIDGAGHHDQQGQMQRNELSQEAHEHPSHNPTALDTQSQNGLQQINGNGNLEILSGNVQQQHVSPVANADSVQICETDKEFKEEKKNYDNPQKQNRSHVIGHQRRSPDHNTIPRNRRGISGRGGQSFPSTRGHTNERHPQPRTVTSRQAGSAGPQRINDRGHPRGEEQHIYQNRTYSNSRGRGRGMGRGSMNGWSPHVYGHREIDAQPNHFYDETFQFWQEVNNEYLTRSFPNNCFYCKLSFHGIDEFLFMRNEFMRFINRHPPWCSVHEYEVKFLFSVRRDYTLSNVAY